ncbi:polysaccharide export outer membrane protein [Paraburkholderia diazotrophica]|uniref:Polysaccharide export outer membrane protein n=2 Tax=Paraburkholderia diazotrophica TaxID=667676 RepID=A0A1H7DYW8_9BURK|nr:polysaccharide export outer membrane protein [Paraburkholderia diazotrophica]
MRASRVRYQPLVMLAACGALSACALAPGMRMESSFTNDTSVTQQTVANLHVIELDGGVVAEMRNVAKRQESAQAVVLEGQPRGYTIGAGDVLNIVVWDHPELAAAQGPQQQAAVRPSDPAPGFVVDEKGNLTFPYAGTLHVAGLPPEEAQQHLALSLSRYLRKPQVTLRVASFRSRQVYVDGQVRSPGAVPVNDVPMTLYEVISRAGGFNDTADQSHIVLVRDGKSYQLNVTQMFESGQSPARIVLRGGDLLRVESREENAVYVMGEVNKPLSAIPRTSGRLTLADALLQAGSLNPGSADAAQMYVIRGSLGGAPQIFHLDGTSPVSMLLAREFDLQPKDVVYVDANGLVRASRVLSLLLPAINAGLTAAVVTK